MVRSVSFSYALLKIFRGAGAFWQPASEERQSASLGAPHRGRTSAWEQLMLDFLMLAIGVGFFVLSVGYVFFCEKV